MCTVHSFIIAGRGPSSLSFSVFVYFSLFPLHFQAGCCRRQLNQALVFVCVDFVLYVFLVKDARLFL